MELLQILTCKYCCRSLQKDMFENGSRVCKDCQSGLRITKEEMKINSSRDLCKYCGKVFEFYGQNKNHICGVCKDDQNNYHTICMKCGEVFSRRENFRIRKFICDECSKKLDEEFDHIKNYRKCNECQQDKKIGKEISKKAFFCFECVRKRRRARVEAAKEKSWVRVCPDCGIDVVTTVPRATVVYCEKCREKKRSLRREKIERYLNRSFFDYCQICKNKTSNDLHKDRIIVCDDCRPLMQEFKNSCLVNGKYYKICVKCGNKFEAFAHSFWNHIYCRDCVHVEPYNPETDVRHQFGYKGRCSDDHRYWSLNEQDFDEWMISRGIKHIPHPRLIPTYRHSDYFLPDCNLHIEVDGLDRKDDVDWYGKLSVYEKLGIE